MKLKYLGLLVIGIVLAILYYFVNPSESILFPKCPLYATTGIHCPGCGSQRAFHELLKFNFLGVLNQNMLFVFGMLTIGYHFLIKGLNHFFNKSYYNYLNHPKTPLIILGVVLVFWILRNIPIAPFNYLAPN